MKNALIQFKIFTCAAALLATGVSLRADDVTDQVNEAVKAYNDKDYAAAAQGLEAAAQLIRQKRAEGLMKFLPEAPNGWTAEDPTNSAAGAQMFGGGISAERKYTKGDSSVTVKLLSDSPLLQGIMMMMNNSMMFAGGDNGKLERIGGQKAIVKYNAKEKDGEINVAVAGTLLVQIEGRDLTAAELKSFAEAIDYKALAAGL